MYKSPIDVFVTDIINQIEKQKEDEIYKAVVSVGINVDKEELIRALQYDRSQYEKGYADGLRDARGNLVRCKDCNFACEGSKGIVCTAWGARTEPDMFCGNGERREGE